MDDLSEEAMPAVDEATHAVVREAKDAGVLLHAGGLDEDVEPVMLAGDGTVTAGTYPETKEFNGGFTVVDVPSREAALEWAARFAAARRCTQEVRAFGFDPLVRANMPSHARQDLPGRVPPARPAHRQSRWTRTHSVSWSAHFD
jgi:hypothetical protein